MNTPSTTWTETEYWDCSCLQTGQELADAAVYMLQGVWTVELKLKQASKLRKFRPSFTTSIRNTSVWRKWQGIPDTFPFKRPIIQVCRGDWIRYIARKKVERQSDRGLLVTRTTGSQRLVMQADSRRLVSRARDVVLVRNEQKTRERERGDEERPSDEWVTARDVTIWLSILDRKSNIQVSSPKLKAKHRTEVVTSLEKIGEKLKCIRYVAEAMNCSPYKQGHRDLEVKHFERKFRMFFVYFPHLHSRISYSSIVLVASFVC